MAAITTNATMAARKSLGAELLSWGTAFPLSRLQLGELVWGDDDHPRTHGVMSGAAEFMAGHGMFAGGGERELRLIDCAGNGLQLEAGAADGEAVDDIRTGDAEADGNPSGHLHTLRHEEILLGDEADGERLIGLLGHAEIALHELALKMQGQGVDANTRSGKVVPEGHIDFVEARAENRHRQENQTNDDPEARSHRLMKV